jgi:hypothetical protein
MTEQSPGVTDHKSAEERRKGLSEDELKDLELAGGVEGCMKAGSGGPSGKDKPASDSAAADNRKSDQSAD